MPGNLRLVKCFLRTPKHLFNHRCQSTSSGVKTALYNFHVEHGGKLVDFAGYVLPVQYNPDSITASHLHTRSKCSLFDVSHMLQVKVHGADRKELLERLTTADVQGLPENKATLSLFTHPDTGGILDDLIITNSSEGYLFVVSNAGRREHDSNLLLRTEEVMKTEKKDISVEILQMDDVSLLALQGPESARVLQLLCSVKLDLKFMNSIVATVGGIENCRISRCGYTGEDGFEISVPSNKASMLAEQLLQSSAGSVKLAGLGARDSLRLEAGLCLYGSDIDEKISPVEASLTWLIAKSRRERKDFPGSQLIMQQIDDGCMRKRVGLRLDGGPPARHDCLVQTMMGENIGTITSGTPSPSLGYPIAMAYVDKKFSKLGTRIQTVVRGKVVLGTIVKMPFLPTKYFN